MANHPDLPDFIGSGWSFPPHFVAEGRTVTLAEGTNEIEESLHILLSTLPGERVMHPKYGCDLTPLLFEPLTTTLQTIIADRVQTSILYFEPRISPEKVEVTIDDPGVGRLLIVVHYRIRSTNSRHNFVFPFYVSEGASTG
ncbi:MAG TPA: GPW/gp25 family protein [Polyangiaceae bacterium]|nr:GPW/gp25 family protein [Polyangiaceae bacterium]